jgi:hypothetical protein
MKYPCAAIVALMLLITPMAYAQTCADPQTARSISCLQGIAKYSQSMIRDDSKHSPLRAGLDSVYANVERAWTGHWYERRYIRALLFWPGVALLSFIVALSALRRWHPPRYPVRKAPEWGFEQIAILVVPLLILSAFAVERRWTFLLMQNDFNRTSAVVAKFLNLPSPKTLAESTKDPCSYAYSDEEYQVWLTRCAETRTTEAKQRVTELAESPLVNPEILEQLKNIGDRCVTLDFVPTWVDANNQRARAEIDQCVVDDTGHSPVVVSDFFPLATSFGAWISPTNTNAPRLQVANVLRVPNIEGGLPFLEKAVDLTSNRLYDKFRSRFSQDTFWTLGLMCLLLIAIAIAQYVLRQRELITGSSQAARARHVLTVGSAVCAVILLILPLTVFLYDR